MYVPHWSKHESREEIGKNSHSADNVLRIVGQDKNVISSVSLQSSQPAEFRLLDTARITSHSTG